MIVVSTYSPSTVGLDIKFQNTPSSPESFEMLAKYDKVSAEEAAVAFRMLTEEGAVVDVAGVVQPEQTPECDGIKIKGVVDTFIIGNYDVIAKLCKPAFIEIITDKLGHGEVYSSKIGLQTPLTAEASVSMYRKVEMLNHAIALMHLRLVAPILADLDFEYKNNEFMALQVYPILKFFFVGHFI